MFTLDRQGLSVRRHGVVGRIPAFLPDGSGSILGVVMYFNFYPGIEFVSLVSVLSCVVSDGGSGSLLTTDFREVRPCVSL